MDGAALRALLIHRKFDDLKLTVEQLQWGMEAAPRNEQWMTDGMAALGNGEPDPG